MDWLETVIPWINHFVIERYNQSREEKDCYNYTNGKVLGFAFVTAARGAGLLNFDFVKKR